MKIFTLLTPVFGISLKNTPPINEIYEQVLRVKHDSKDGQEKLLLELSDLAKEWEKGNEKKDQEIGEMKKDLGKIKKGYSIMENAISEGQVDAKALAKTLEAVVNELQSKMEKTENSINEQHSQAQELIQRVDTEIDTMKAEFTIRVESAMSESEKMNRRLDEIEIQQETFIRMTKSQLAELSKIEHHNEKILSTIQDREDKNRRGMATIRDFESSTANQIQAHETELKMLQRSMKAMQNRLNVDEFKEERLQDTMTQMTLEMLNKIASLEIEIVDVMSGNAPVEVEKQQAIADLSNELKSIEHLVLFQQSEIQQMDTANEMQVVELKNTDSSLRTKLSTVEKEIHEIGSGIVFRNEFMKKFQY